MESLAELAGRPDRCAPSIHIAGSKGKGSVTGMIVSMLEADGRRVARYMSPHISDFRERISLGNSFFDEAVYRAAGDELRELVEQRLPPAKHSLFDPACEDGEAPSFFELLTLYFFLCARCAGCDALVVETGMGGRLDSTNIVDPLVSVITLIELEHTAFLGKTITAVAGEKAGIIKSGRPLILAKQRGEALEVFRKKAEEQRSPFLYFPELVELRDIKIHAAGTNFTMSLKPAADTRYAQLQQAPLFPPLLNLAVPVPGLIQAENAGLAILAMKAAFPQTGDGAIRRGLEHFRLPARFELLLQDPPLIIDGAHTPESAAGCAETFCSLYGEGGILLFGCAADKNAAAMAEMLLPRFSRIIITTPGTFKTSDPGKVYEAFNACLARRVQGCAATGRVTLVRDTKEALKQALNLARGEKLPVLCMGSFYLAAEIRNADFLK
ncbi:bifunctional folylpolyglutamate synthase/dihydrofolate synthase [Spirochaetia bacterium]|nr:bifunctional folylpolyglutamate synthase/dihydrofolate synthase [Spirochaetia bacterium]